MNATIKDVARATGLSIATISKYLNGGNVREENRGRIARAVEELGYRANVVARGLKMNRTMTVGALVPDLRSVFCMAILSRLEDVLTARGYSLLVCDCGGDARREGEKLTFLASRQVDGMVLLPSGGALPGLAELTARGIPAVLVDRPLPGHRCDTVLVDNSGAAKAAVGRLVALGHRRIGIVCGPDGAFTARERYQGYAQALGEAGISLDEALVGRGNYDLDSGYRLFGALVDGPARPTAVFVTNYEMTLGAVMAANERGLRFPDDLSFVGFDNLQLSAVVKPALTMVAQPMEELGDAAAALLLRRMAGDGDGFPALMRLHTTVVPGASVGPPAGEA